MIGDAENRDMGIRQIADKLRTDMASESPPGHYIDRWAEYIYENWVVPHRDECDRDRIRAEVEREFIDEMGLDEILEELIPK